MRHLAILGASGHGKVVADTAEACGWKNILFFDDAWPAIVANGPWTVAGTSSDLFNRLKEFSGVIVAIGNNTVRYAKLVELIAAQAPLVTLVHPRSVLSPYARLGVGSVVFAGAVINAGAVIGRGAIINTGCSVDHDCQLGEGVHVSPGAHLAGGVVIGDKSWIGIGATVRQLICIGSNVTVGASSGVVRDVPDNIVVVGVPARALG
ncbi:acetyltransferase [Pseudomonas plecoglossicida]|uniref:Acetyltransferase n=1 Tax=Pseudomonas plecoglossicida TaxID=70775 RepID=A0AAD0R0S7_PSEDL|nr:acetyltransferase [Pseudomonas plecoglossicida]AXM95956.1 acetyltransferase [Pseudomonas plecoglossicida]EPB97099.1 Trimeric LpxA-like family protein [Pseudomonas plecoglossicida NB2011]QLB56708.1 acetyltransferase [Pseudomonas plecoglossicida]